MASKRALRRKSCGRKVRYQTQEAALTGLRSLIYDKGWQGKMFAYHCQFCRGFHYGHPPARVRQSLKARGFL